MSIKTLRYGGICLDDLLTETFKEFQVSSTIKTYTLRKRNPCTTHRDSRLKGVGGILTKLCHPN